MNFKISNQTKVIVLIQAILFLALIVFGISGSSISLIKNFAPGLVDMDDHLLIGSPKAIRSDEWAVNTMFSIGQYQNKENKNPRFNNNIGPTPRDMSVIQDSGAPTKELSTFARVHLWGFFIFDLRKALAWYWWAPVFISLNGIWLLLNLICPGQSRFNLSLAFLFTIAPQSVLWSNWPLMHVGAAAWTVSLAILALKSNNILINLTLATFTGLFMCWFTLQLQLPRLVPVVLVSAATYLGYCITSHSRFFTRNNCIFIIYALLIFFLLIFDWIYHNFEAIFEITNSTYPGKRRIYGGTPVSNWDFKYIRGWLFPITSEDSYLGGYPKMPGNPPEAMSYISLFLPIIGSVLYLLKKCKKINFIILLNFGLLLLLLAYEYIGLPKIIGDITFLNRSHNGRIIIGVGFISIILIAFLYKYRNIIALKHKLILLGFYLLPFIIFFYKNLDLLIFLEEHYLFKLVYIVLFVIVIHVVFLYKIKYITFIALLFIAPSTLFWNPIIIAPSHVQVNFPNDFSSQNMKEKHGGRFLVATNDFAIPNLFMASAHPVMNATSNYIDSYMFNNFYSKLDAPESYKRYNHLIVSVDNLTPDMRISLGGGDWIKMNLNARNFDFSTFPIDYVVVRNSAYIADLNANSKLHFMGNVGEFYYYKVNNN